MKRNGGLFGMGNGGSSSRGGPRHHTSLDNLRGGGGGGGRNQTNGSVASRSFPQLPSESTSSRSNYSNSSNTNEFANNTSPWMMNDHRSSGEQNNNNTIWNTIMAIFTGMAALCCIAGVATLLFILFVLVRPFSQSAYRRMASQMGEAYFLDAMALLLPGVKLYLSGDSDVPSPVGTSIIVCNHLMDADWWAILMLGRCVGLRGSLKIFLRNEVLHLSSRRPSTEGGTNNGSPNSPSTQVTVVTAGGGSPSSTQVTIPTSNGSNNKTVTFAASRSNGSFRGSGGGSSSNNSNGNGGKQNQSTTEFVKILARMLHTLLEFPLLSGENRKDYISDRANLFELLRSFAEHNGAATPVHLLLFPEGWSLHDIGNNDRKAILAKSNEFAKREGRPQLKHLLLPRTTGFNACLESLRESSPVVYDITMAYGGYDGTIPASQPLSLPSLWMLLRRQFPSEIHFRIKRYSMEEVLQDASWLDKQWADKDRMLSHFSRHQEFPTDSRGFCRHRVFDTRQHAVESSVLALLRLLILPFTIPILLFFAIPLFWVVLWVWILYQTFKTIIPSIIGGINGTRGDQGGSHSATQTPSGSGASGTDSAVVVTPFIPATPFATPSITNWRDVKASSSSSSGESPSKR